MARMASEPVLIRTLTVDDAAAYRQLRLEALSDSPEAFSSSYEEESVFPEQVFRERAAPPAPSAVFGALAGGTLVGMAAFLANNRPKQRHKAVLAGVFVQPGWRRARLGERLVSAVIDHAARHVLILTATVVMTNQPARQLYRRLGFIPYGVESRGIRVGERFFDEELLALELPGASGHADKPRAGT
jgi:ribosomal protein S18 acetylase RimI-like enzyme